MPSCFQRQCCGNRRLEVTQSQHTFPLFFFKFQYEIKGGTSTFSPQILSLRGFFAGSTDDQWTWQVILVWWHVWETKATLRLRAPQTDATHTPLQSEASQMKREKEESKVVSFQAWYETLNRIYLSLLVQVPSKPWIFCKTLLTTTGHRSELNSAAWDLGLRKLLKPWNIHAAEHLLSSWCACRLVWCRQVTPAAGWLTDVGRDSPWVRRMGFKC